MGLFSAFSSSSGKKAAKKAYGHQTAGYRLGQKDYDKYLKQGIGSVTGGRNQAIRSSTDYYNRARNALQTGTSGARADIRRGTNQATNLNRQALGAWRPALNRARLGATAYGNATGIYGDSGYDSARQNFQHSPGYQMQVDEAMQAINRNRASQGMLASGNTDVDTMNRITGLADQDWSDYVARLQPFLGLEQTAAQGMSGIYGNMADNVNQGALNQANLQSGLSANLANIASNQGSQLGGYYQNAGNNVGNMYQNAGTTARATQLGLGQAGYDMEQNQYGAEQGANQNMWNAILGLAGPAVSAYGMLKTPSAPTNGWNSTTAYG